MLESELKLDEAISSRKKLISTLLCHVEPKEERFLRLFLQVERAELRALESDSSANLFDTTNLFFGRDELFLRLSHSEGLKLIRVASNRRVEYP